MRLASFIVLLMIAAPAAAAQAPSPAVQALVEAYEAKRERGEALVVELASMAARDQFIRAVFIEAMGKAKTESDRKAFIAAASAQMQAIDSANTKRLQEILTTISWSDLAAISPRAANDARLIVSHSPDSAFQARMLEVFEPLVRTGVVRGEDYALLYDDVAMNAGRKQRYGSNFDCIDGVRAPQPLENPSRVDEWRRELGMETLADYAKQMEQIYGACPRG